MVQAIRAATKSNKEETRENGQKALDHWISVQDDWKAKESMVVSYEGARMKGRGGKPSGDPSIR